MTADSGAWRTSSGSQAFVSVSVSMSVFLSVSISVSIFISISEFEFDFFPKMDLLTPSTTHQPPRVQMSLTPDSVLPLRAMAASRTWE